MALLGRDDRAWIRAARAGSVSEFESLFRAHWPRAYRAVYLVTQDHAAAETIVQDAFLATVRRLDRLDDEEFAPGLHRQAMGRAIDFARGQLGRWRLAGESAFDETAPIWPVHAGRSRPHIGPDAQATAIGLAALAPEYRAVLVLRYVLDYEPVEIASILELSRSTARDRLRRSLEQLQGRLEG